MNIHLFFACNLFKRMKLLKQILCAHNTFDIMMKILPCQVAYASLGPTSTTSLQRCSCTACMRLCTLTDEPPKIETCVVLL